MKPLSELPAEMKALVTATIIFLGIGVLMALAYLDASHVGTGGNLWITPRDIASMYRSPGVSITTLLSLAHIHLLALALVFWMVGYIFVHSSFACRWKIFWSVLPFGAFLIDVAGWFLTRLNYYFVYFVLIGGALFITALAVMMLLSLYDMWVTPRHRLTHWQESSKSATPEVNPFASSGHAMQPQENHQG